MTLQYPDRPICGVGVVVLRNQSVLLIRRGREPRKGQLALPGGKQKLGETVFEAASREVLEETGLHIRELVLLDIVDSITHDEHGKIKFHYTLCEVLAMAANGEPIAASDADEAFWVPLQRIDSLELWSETRRIIELAVQKHREYKKGLKSETN